MFFEISKFLNFFISPVTWIILLLIGAFVCKNKKLRKTCLFGSIAVFIIFTNSVLVGYVKSQTIKEYCQANIDTTKQYRLAIVMGGFASINKQTGQLQYEQDRADRLWEAVRLWRKGTVEQILITGDPSSVIEKDGTSTASQFLQYMNEMQIPQSVFVLEQQALNSTENARYTAALLKQMNVPDTACVLITSATHMKRSLKCFAQEGLYPDYLPVHTQFLTTTINHKDFYPSWKAAVEWQELLNEWIGEIIYRVMGYI